MKPDATARQTIDTAALLARVRSLVDKRSLTVDL